MANIHSIYGWFFQYFRPRRLRQFRKLIPEVMTEIGVLDVGGMTYQWDYLESPANVTILNTQITERTTTHDKYSFVQGDGRRLTYNDNSYDLVFSNSVIEHVGRFDDQRMFAEEMRRVGRMLYCQTPNKWFLVEPHLITVFVHWLPRNLQRKLIRWFSVWGWVEKPSGQQIEQFLDTTRLLTYRELKSLFPDCEIVRERFLGITKSFVVVRRE
jgi:hypothetical protein